MKMAKLFYKNNEGKKIEIGTTHPENFFDADIDLGLETCRLYGTDTIYGEFEGEIKVLYHTDEELGDDEGEFFL